MKLITTLHVRRLSSFVDWNAHDFTCNGFLNFRIPLMMPETCSLSVVVCNTSSIKTADDNDVEKLVKYMWVNQCMHSLITFGNTFHIWETLSKKKHFSYSNPKLVKSWPIRFKIQFSSKLDIYESSSVHSSVQIILCSWLIILTFKLQLFWHFHRISHTQLKWKFPFTFEHFYNLLCKF